MLNFGKYTDINETTKEEIANLLNEPENIIRMETASDLKHPAVQGIERQLYEKFGKKLKNENRTKMLIGYLVRQIMENICGYSLERYGMRINGKIFTTGSVYKRHLD